MNRHKGDRGNESNDQEISTAPVFPEEGPRAAPKTPPDSIGQLAVSASEEPSLEKEGLHANGVDIIKPDGPSSKSWDRKRFLKVQNARGGLKPLKEIRRTSSGEKIKPEYWINSKVLLKLDPEWRIAYAVATEISGKRFPNSHKLREAEADVSRLKPKRIPDANRILIKESKRMMEFGKDADGLFLDLTELGEIILAEKIIEVKTEG